MRSKIIRNGALAILVIVALGLASVRMGADANTVILVGGLAGLFVVTVVYTILWLNPRVTILRLDRRSGHGNRFSKRGDLYVTLAGSQWQQGLGFEASQISVSELIELRRIKTATPLLLSEAQLTDIMSVTSDLMGIEQFIEQDALALRPDDQIIVIHGDVERLAQDFSNPAVDIQKWAQNAPEVWFQLVTVISKDE